MFVCSLIRVVQCRSFCPLGTSRTVRQIKSMNRLLGKCTSSNSEIWKIEPSQTEIVNTLGNLA